MSSEGPFILWHAYGIKDLRPRLMHRQKDCAAACSQVLQTSHQVQHPCSIKPTCTSYGYTEPWQWRKFSLDALVGSSMARTVGSCSSSIAMASLRFCPPLSPEPAPSSPTKTPA